MRLTATERMLRETSLGKGIMSFLENICKNFPLHPNLVTFLSIVFSLGGFISFYFYYNAWLAFLLFIFAFIFDALDGAIARAKHLETKFGAFIDGVSDRIVEFLLILVLMKVNISYLLLSKEMWLLLILFFGSFMTSFVRAYAYYVQAISYETARKMSAMLERGERAVLLMMIFLLALLNNEYASIVLMFTAVLSFLSFIERSIKVYGLSAGKK